MEDEAADRGGGVEDAAALPSSCLWRQQHMDAAAARDGKAAVWRTWMLSPQDFIKYQK